jgi:glycosyltransferase involved in cell wall biosynthesis
LLIAGEGSELPALKRLAVGLRVSDSIQWLGHLDQAGVADSLARSQTLVLPSTAEVWGLVVNEAIAAGLQVVVSSRCGVAAELQGIPGAYTADPDARSLSLAMSAAEADWSGFRYDSPFNVRMSPSAMASNVAAALRDWSK